MSELSPIAAPPRYWTAARVKMAQLLAEGQLTNAQIYKRIGKSDHWYYQTKRDVWFQDRVRELQTALAEDAKRIGIANQATRLRAQNARWEAMLSVIEARAAAMADAAPGTDFVAYVRLKGQQH